MRFAATARADALRMAVAARLRSTLPGAVVEVEGERVLLKGRDVVRRWMTAARFADWRGDGR